MKNTMKSCWCGNNELASFSTDYALCTRCQTLVSQAGLSPEETLVKNDDEDFYGKKYWLSHQQEDLGYPDIHQRARSDLSERCLHWIQTLLKYKLPPAKILEIGCSHGGFVSLLRQAGYDATGLELSPWVAEFSRQTFDNPMLVGTLEEQSLADNTFDVIALMDVFEHLSHPLATIRKCLDLLKPNGILLMQTPCYSSGKSYADFVAKNDPFLSMLKSDEHLQLFSKEAVKMFFGKLDVPYIEYEPAIFSQYDMSFVASKIPARIISQSEIDKSMSETATRRFVQASIDLYNHNQFVAKQLAESEIDRANRLEQIHILTALVNKSQVDAETSLLKKFKHYMKKSQLGKLIGMKN